MTRARRRRLRDSLISAYRDFGTSSDFEVLGLHQDLSQRYPVAPLLGAQSAQAELALTGEWDQWNAVVALVLVRPARLPSPRAYQDTVVQLTILDTGSSPLQYSAVVGRRRPEIAMLSGHEADASRLDRFLRQASGAEELWRGDHLAGNEVQVLHTRRLTRAHVDIQGPLRLLSAMTAALD